MFKLGCETEIKIKGFDGNDCASKEIKRFSKR